MQQQSSTIQIEDVPISVKEQVVAITDTSKVIQQRMDDSTIRVDVDRLDNLMNLVGELVLARNRLTQVTQSIIEKYERIEMSKQIVDISSQIDFVTTELQMAVMKTRMVPIVESL